ncbi:MAG: winged-helix domain-containing protein, partial [Peptostreptococcaceae bacterium]
NDDITYLKEKTCIEKTIDVMACINVHKSSGRNSIFKELNERDVFITEGEIRHILEVLKDRDIIISKSGRKGSELSHKGLEILKKMK